MAQRNDGGPQHEIPDDGDPLLVRPFLTGEPGTSDASPSPARWPAERYPGGPGHDAPPILEAPAERGPWSPDGPGQGRRRLHVGGGAIDPPTPSATAGPVPTPPATAGPVPTPPATAGPGSTPPTTAAPVPAGPAATGAGTTGPGGRFPEPATAIGAAVRLGGGVSGPPRSDRAGVAANVPPVWRAGTSAAPAGPATATAEPTGAAHPPQRPGPSGREIRRRRSYALAGAGAAAILGLAAIGYGVFPTADRHETALPSGALPPPVTASGPSAARGAAPGTPGRSPAPAPPVAPGTATGPAAGTAPGTPPGGIVPAGPGTAAAAPGGTTPATESAGPAPEATAPTPVDTVEPVPSVARVGPIASDSNLCLGVDGSVPAGDRQVQIDDCNGTSAQRWTLATDGTLQAVGKCAQVTGDATVAVIGCDDRDEAQWRAGQDDSLVNLATNKCLTGPANGDQPGAEVVVSACTGGDNQQWDLP